MGRKKRHYPMKWRFVGSCLDGKPLNVYGRDVWSHKWHRVPRTTAHVVDSRYGHVHEFFVYEIIDPDARDRTRLIFAAGELSNLIWAFYVPDPPAPATAFPPLEPDS